MPIIEDVDGFVRVLNTKIEAKDAVLVILYFKNPSKVRDADLLKWTRYSNPTRFKSILTGLDKSALIHYDNEKFCTLLRPGILYVEKQIDISAIS